MTNATLLIALVVGMLVGASLVVLGAVLVLRWRPVSVSDGATPLRLALREREAANEIPGHATEERESKAQIIETGAERIVQAARDMGVSMTHQQARDQAALMIGEAGL